MTSRIVAIDTTSESGSLALLESGRVLDEVSVLSTEGFGHVLFPQLERLLSRHGWSPADVDCYAAAAGPGSFTGVRVGLAAIKGLGEALGKPVVTVSNLQAVASHGTALLRAVALDARRGEVYGAVYSAALKLVLPERVLGLSAWVDTLPEPLAGRRGASGAEALLDYERQHGQSRVTGEIGFEFLSTDFSAFAAELAQTRFRDAPRRTVPRALAAAVGRIAAGRLAAGLATDPAAADANYVRRSDAELLWKEP